MKDRPRVALVTCVQLPEDDPDEALLLESLRQQGMDAELLPWDDPEGNPARFDLCVLRSCWNYFEQPEAFLSWVSRASTSSRLANPLEIIQWNIHKSYLQKLKNAGVPIVPTVWLQKGERSDLRGVMREQGWHEVVVKPSVSAASYRTRRFHLPEVEGGQLFLDALLRDRDAMIQRYLPAAGNPGERALVWIDGEPTHAVAKSPRFEDGVEQVSDAQEVTEGERAIVDRALSCVEGPLLYARVDIMVDGDRGACISELELMEPSLFLLQHPPALRRFVAAIKRWCTTGRSRA